MATSLTYNIDCMEYMKTLPDRPDPVYFTPERPEEAVKKLKQGGEK